MAWNWHSGCDVKDLNRGTCKDVRGFTAVEMVIVVVLMAILTSIAVRSFGNVLSSTNVRGARNVFRSLHARARAQAIERGQLSRLIVNAGSDQVVISIGADTLETVNFGTNFEVDIQLASGTSLTLCMSPRGFAEMDCNSFTGAQTIVLASGSGSFSMELLPMGQLVF